MPQKKDAKVKHILQLSGEIFNLLRPNLPVEHLSPDLTVAQLRALLLLYTDGPAKMSSIAAILHVAVSSATGVIDNLVRKELVVREDDPQDRRVVICKLSPAGQELINRLWLSGEFQIEGLLEGLTAEELQKAADVAEMLLANVKRKISKKSG